jgi:hypothetical protein
MQSGGAVSKAGPVAASKPERAPTSTSRPPEPLAPRQNLASPTGTAADSGSFSPAGAAKPLSAISPPDRQSGRNREEETGTGKDKHIERPAVAPEVAPGGAAPGVRAIASGASQRAPQLEAEKAYARPFNGKDTDAAAGENLAFDFTDEEPAPDQTTLSPQRRRRRVRAVEPPRDEGRWEVGDDEPSTRTEPSQDHDRKAGKEHLQPHRRRERALVSNESEFDEEPDFVDDQEAPVYNRAITHSARFFLMLLMLVVAGFGAVSLLIHNAPATASMVLSHLPLLGDRFVVPVNPARLVALRDVSAAYQQSKDGHSALVISGTAENVGTNSLRLVQLTAALRDGEHRRLASQVVYCGNNLSAAMINQMTPHEIEFFQGLEPARTFSLEPSADCRFVAVFTTPPKVIHTYDISVSQAVPGAAPDVEEPAS